jgi:hypothetical protein
LAAAALWEAITCASLAAAERAATFCVRRTLEMAPGPAAAPGMEAAEEVEEERWWEGETPPGEVEPVLLPLRWRP